MTNITKENFKQIFTGLGYVIEPEFKFCSNRKFRADWKVNKKDKDVLIEYEGIFSAKARHTSITGYTKDCEKYNLMTKLGYKFLRYTALNFNDVITDLEQVFSEHADSVPVCSDLLLRTENKRTEKNGRKK